LEIKKRDGLLIATARRDEYSPLLEAYPFKLKKVGEKEYFVYKNIRLIQLGIGPQQVRSTVSQLPDDFFNSKILIAGTAGSLSPEIKPGDVFITGKATFDINHETFEADKKLRSRLLQTLNEQLKRRVRTGALLTTSIPLITKEKRLMGAENYAADAADMETGALLSELKSRPQKPIWAGLRVISDSLETKNIRTAIAKQPTACRALGKILQLIVARKLSNP
jgi:purine-nucleoside phosphorylase